MADIVPTLFGLTPEAYQQQQAAAADRMALEYAKLDPLQQAQFAIGRGAYQLAGALGGALGAQDPQLQLISRRNAIAKQINYGDLGSIQQGIQQLSGFDPVGAMQLTQVLQERLKSTAEIGRLEAAAQASRAAAARERLPSEALQKAQRRAQLTMLLSDPGLTGEQRGAYEAENRALMSKEELEAEEAARQARDFQGISTSGTTTAAQPASMPVQPGLIDELTSMGVFAPGAAQQTMQAAAPTAMPTADVSNIETQLANARREISQLARFSKVPEAKARVEQLQPLVRDLEKRLVNVRLDDQYKSMIAATPNMLEAPAATLPSREQLAIRQAQLTRISDLAASGSPLAKRDESFINDEIKALRTRIAKEEEPFQAGEEAERFARRQFGKAYRDLTQAQMAIVDRLVSEETGKKAPKIIMPGERVGPKDWMQFEKFVGDDPTLKRTNELLAVAPNAIQTISRITSNDVAARALPATLARLVGETGPLAIKDIERFARTGGLDDRLAQAATEFISGRGTNRQKDQAMQFLSAVYRGALLEKKQFYMDQAERLGYDKSPEYTKTLQQIDRELAKFREIKPPVAAPATQPSTTTAPTGKTGNPLIDKYLSPGS